MDGPKGFFEAQWKGVSGRYVLLFVRTTGEGHDPWGRAKVVINDRTSMPLTDVSGSRVVIVDLGQETAIEKLRVEIDGKTFPGLAGVEIYRGMGK